MSNTVIRILIEHDAKAGRWLAQCIDFDLVAQAKSRDELLKAFGHVLYGNLILALERGYPPPTLREAPEYLHEKWRETVGKTGTTGQVIPWGQIVPEWFGDAIKKLSRVDEPRAEQVLLAEAPSASSKAAERRLAVPVIG